MTAKHKIIITRNFKTKKEIKNGLMNIKYLKPNEGALFNMKTNRKHHFWMKNTLIPLDMIFMNKSNKVVGIVKNAKPYDESLYYINVASEKIIEILRKKINYRVVQCLSDQKDRYKRYIAICYVDGVNLNQWLVLNGWAVAYQKYSKAYINAEAIARSQEVEIWSGEFILPWKWRRGKRLKK